MDYDGVGHDEFGDFPHHEDVDDGGNQNLFITHASRSSHPKQFDDRTPISSPNPIASSTCMKESDLWRNNPEDPQNSYITGGVSPPIQDQESAENTSSSLGLLKSDAFEKCGSSLLTGVSPPVEEGSSPKDPTPTADQDQDVGEEANITQSDPRLDQNELDALDEELDDFADQKSDVEIPESSGGTGDPDFVTAPSGMETQIPRSLTGSTRTSQESNSEKFSSFPAQASDRSLEGVNVIRNPFDDSPNQSGAWASDQAPPGLAEEWEMQQDLQDAFQDEFLEMDEGARRNFLEREEVENLKRHRFIPEDVMEVSEQETTETSWSLPGTEAVPKPDWFSNIGDIGDMNGSKLSASTLFRMRSETLGNISDENARRPFWGTNVRSPDLMEPAELIEPEAEDQKRSLMDEIQSNTSMADVDEEEREVGPSRGPAVSTPLRESSMSAKNVAQAIPPILPGLSTLSIVEHHVDPFKTFQNPDRSGMRRNSRLVSKDIPSMDHLGLEKNGDDRGNDSAQNESSVLSLSSIQKCIASAPVGANASTLAQVMMKSKTGQKEHQTLWTRKRDVYQREKSSHWTQSLRASPSFSSSPAHSSWRQNESLSPGREGAARASIAKSKLESINSTSKLESNKQKLFFGCVDVGQSAVQSVTLRNCSREILRLSLSLRHSRPGFQVGDENHRGDCVLLHPEETFSLKVLFRPKEASLYSNKVMFSLASCSEKFSIPVMGQGGSANLRLDLFDSRQDGVYQLWFSSPRKVFLLKNQGVRAAFFKIVSDPSPSSPAPFTPHTGVVQAGRQVNIAVHSEELNVAKATVFWGEELQRIRLRSFEKKRGSSAVKIGGISFTEEFPNEEQEKFDPDDVGGVSSSDCRLFVGSLRNIQLRLLPAPRGLNSTVFKSFVALHPDNTLVNSSLVPLGSPTLKSSPATTPGTPRKRLESPPQKGPPAKLQAQGIDKQSSYSGAVTVNPKKITFAPTKVNAWDSVKLEFRNVTKTSHTIRLRIISGPFCVKCPEYRIDAMKYVKIAVYFEPKDVGEFLGCVEVSSDYSHLENVPLKGKAIP